MSLAPLQKQLEELKEYDSKDEPEPAKADLAFRRDLSHALVVGGLPVVPESKAGKLMAVLGRLLIKLDSKLTKERVFMPVEEGKTVGVMFVEFSHPRVARDAAKKLNGYALDKRHTFKVCRYADLQRVAGMPDELPDVDLDTFPPRINLQTTLSENPHTWLRDRRLRDQLVVRHNDKTEVCWLNTDGEPEVLYDGSRVTGDGKVWCDQFVAWSSHGSFLATLHKQGIVTWAGTSFRKVNRFSHFNVQCVDFSPCERYMVSWDGRAGPHVRDAVIVWDVRTATRLRSFAFIPPRTGADWPMLRWSTDGNLAARVVEDTLLVYQAPSFTPVKSAAGGLRVPGIQEFSWQPNAHVLAYWTPEKESVAAQIVLFDVEAGRKLVSKNLFRVQHCSITWQNRGDFCAVQVSRLSKSKKRVFLNVEVFRMRDKDYPVESLNLGEETGSAVAFEPNGTRLAVIHCPAETRADLSVYDLGAIEGGAKCEEAFMLEGRQCNELHWSPGGRYLLAAGLDAPFNGSLEFVDTHTGEALATADHYMCNFVEWDSAGRYVITAVNSPMEEASVRYQLEAGFRVWSFQGEMLHALQQPGFYQVLFRPVPKLPLSEEEKSDVETRLKEFYPKYREMDRRSDVLKRADRLRERRRMRDEWHEQMEELARSFSSCEARREELGLPSLYVDESTYEETEMEEEHTIDTVEEVI